MKIRDKNRGVGNGKGSKEVGEEKVEGDKFINIYTEAVSNYGYANCPVASVDDVGGGDAVVNDEKPGSGAKINADIGGVWGKFPGRKIFRTRSMTRSRHVRWTTGVMMMMGIGK